MTDIKATTTLRAVVNKARMRGSVDSRYDHKIFQYVLDGMKDLSLFHSPHKIAVKLVPDSLGRIYYPQDCLRFLSVGVPYQGKYFTFTKDGAYTVTSDKTYSYEAYNTEYGENTGSPAVSYRLYTSGGTNDTAFYLNDKERYVQLIGAFPTKVTMHYVSAGIPESADEVEIDKKVEPALIAYALWQLIEYDPNVSINERMYRENRYGAELQDLDDLNYKPTVDELMDVYYSTLYQGVKRL